MEQITITEALSEVNLIKKKIKAAHEKVSGMLFRLEHQADPFASEGGSAEVVKRELQSIGDLNGRLVGIRAAISRANLDNIIMINGFSQSIHNWLIWKREIAEIHSKFVANVINIVGGQQASNSARPQVYKDERSGEVMIVKQVINIEYPKWLEMQARQTETFEKLDGQLSLKNATILISI